MKKRENALQFLINSYSSQKKSTPDITHCTGDSDKHSHDDEALVCLQGRDITHQISTHRLSIRKMTKEVKPSPGFKPLARLKRVNRL